MTAPKPRLNPAQLILPFVFLPRKTYRSIVLEVVNQSSEWRTARDIASEAQLTYKQTIFALHALHNHGKIVRTGRTFKARWGPFALQPKPKDNFLLLTSLFNGSFKPRKPGIK